MKVQGFRSVINNKEGQTIRPLRQLNGKNVQYDKISR